MTLQQSALLELLAMHDPPELIRGHRLTVEGDEDRLEVIWPDLVRAYTAYQLHAREDMRH